MPPSVSSVSRLLWGSIFTPSSSKGVRGSRLRCCDDCVSYCTKCSGVIPTKSENCDLRHCSSCDHVIQTVKIVAPYSNNNRIETIITSCHRCANITSCPNVVNASPTHHNTTEASNALQAISGSASTATIPNSIECCTSCASRLRALSECTLCSATCLMNCSPQSGGSKCNSNGRNISPSRASTSTTTSDKGQQRGSRQS